MLAVLVFIDMIVHIDPEHKLDLMVSVFRRHNLPI